MTRLWQRFVAPVGDAELPELDRFLVRGVRVAALVYAPLLLPLAFALALRGGRACGRGARAAGRRAGRDLDLLRGLAHAARAASRRGAPVHGSRARQRGPPARRSAPARRRQRARLGGAVRAGVRRDVRALAAAALARARARRWRRSSCSRVWLLPARAGAFPLGPVVTALASGIAGALASRAHRAWWTPRPPRAKPADAARNAALSADKAKSEFLANMSHEIRTPLTAILGFTDELIDEAARTGTALGPDPALLTVKRNGHHLLAIVNDVLDLARIEAGKLTVQDVPCAPLRVVADVVSLLRPRAVEKQLRLDVRLRGAIPEMIRSDPTRVNQILVNLVGNAIKFTEHGGVTLRLELLPAGPDRAAPLLAIDVIDTGDRPRAERAPAHLRRVRAGRRLAHPPPRRHGPRAHDLARARAPARRRHRGRERARRRQRVPRDGRDRLARGRAHDRHGGQRPAAARRRPRHPVDSARARAAARPRAAGRGRRRTTRR